MLYHLQKQVQPLFTFFIESKTDKLREIIQCKDGILFVAGYFIQMCQPVSERVIKPGFKIPAHFPGRNPAGKHKRKSREFFPFYRKVVLIRMSAIIHERSVAD